MKYELGNLMAEDPQQETINLLTYRLNAVSTELAAVTEQRDRLAEALKQIQGVGLVAVDAFDELDRIDEIVDEALQSLNQPTP